MDYESDLRSACSLSWNKVSRLLESTVQGIIGRTIKLHAWAEDTDYWGVMTKDTRLSLEELAQLLGAVNAPEYVKSIIWPEEGTQSTNSFGMELGSLLLRKGLKAEWSHEHIMPCELWLLGFADNVTHPYTQSGLLKKAYDGELMTMHEVLSYLKENGATDRSLSDIREQHCTRFGNELCWRYPITDGIHMGTFILCVREGFLSLPFNSADEEVYEILVLQDAALCDTVTIKQLLSDWNRFSYDLADALETMRISLELPF